MSLPEEFRKVGIEPQGKKPDPDKGVTLFLVLLVGFMLMALMMLHTYHEVNP